MTHDDYVEILIDTFVSQATKSLILVITTKLPFLVWGPFGPLLSFVVTKMLTVVARQTELITYFYYTDFRVARQGKAFNQAAIQNYEARNGTDAEKKLAEDNLINSFRNLVKLTN